MIYEEALEMALAEVKDSHAQIYLQAIPQATRMYGSKGLRIQLMYCLCNMQYYRGETAREVKKAFKDKIKELSR